MIALITVCPVQLSSLFSFSIDKAWFSVQRHLPVSARLRSLAKRRQYGWRVSDRNDVSDRVDVWQPLPPRSKREVDQKVTIVNSTLTVSDSRTTSTLAKDVCSACLNQMENYAQAGGRHGSVCK